MKENRIEVSEQNKQFFEKEGYLVLEQAYTVEEVDRLVEVYNKQWIDLAAAGKIVQTPNRPLNSLFPRLRDYHRDHQEIVDFIISPSIIKVLEQLLGEEMLAVQTSYYFKAPGASGLPLHQDNYSIGAVPDTTYAVWVGLDAADRENGGLVLVPGSHHSQLTSPEKVPEYVTVYGQRIPKPEDAETVELSTGIGDVVIFNGNVYHGSTDNNSRHQFRRALVTHYARTSVERITLNYNYLIDKRGNKVRKRFNPQPKVIETKSNVFEFATAKYFDQLIKRD